MVEKPIDRNELYRKFMLLGHGKDDCSNAIFEMLLDAAMRVEAGDIVLDLGAGQCRYAFFFEHGNYLSVDFGKGDGKWDYSKLDVLGDITKPTFIRSESVDFILNTSTLEHLSEPFIFFNEMSRILKPGGVLFLYVPFLIAEHQEPYDFFRYTRYGLEHLCQKSGLGDVKILASNGPLQTAVRLFTGGISQSKPRSFTLRVILKAIRLFSEWFITPILDYIDRFSTCDSSPLCWILTAKKEGNREKSQMDKQNALNSVLCCPCCSGSLQNCHNVMKCILCNKFYPIRDGQISFTALYDK